MRLCFFGMLGYSVLPYIFFFSSEGTMNTDIRLSVGFWQHPKTKKMIKRLGLEGIRSLQVLWLWAAQNRPDGNLSGMDDEDIELAADWQGEDGKFLSVCREMWFDTTESGLILHNWEEHNPWQTGAQARSDKARKAAQARWGHAQAMLKVCSRNAQALNEQCPSPLLSSPKGNKKKDSLRSSFSPEFSTGASGKKSGKLAVEQTPQKELPPQHAPQDASQTPSFEAVITLPLNTGKEHPVTQGEIEQWQDLYPAVDVLQALRSMRGWLLGNKTRRKTKNGIGRFIQHWLAKEQDNGRTRASPFTPGTTHDETKTVFYVEKGTMSPYGTFWESMLKNGHATPEEVAKKGYDLDDARTIFRAGKGNQGRARLEAANRNPIPDLVGNMR